jgi:hypothetical protein
MDTVLYEKGTVPSSKISGSNGENYVELKQIVYTIIYYDFIMKLIHINLLFHCWILGSVWDDLAQQQHIQF